MKKNLLGYGIKELKENLKNTITKDYQVKQIYRWIYNKRITDINEFTNISKGLRKKIGEKFSFEPLKVLKVDSSNDGSRKYLLELEDGERIEAVFIPQRDRTSICLSSQVGCKFGCKFCLTGLMGFRRNLFSYEIVSQLITILINEKKNLAERVNLVFMGMGEPLDNYENLKKAIELITDPEGISISPKRITVSTIGITDYLEKFLIELKDVKLAFSLNSPFSEKRRELMPVEKKYPLKKNLNLLKKFSKKLKYRVTFEYIMLKGVNDSYKDALELLRITKGIPKKINLIPFNYFEGSELQPSPMERINEFVDFLRKYRIVVTIRDSKGKDIKASCGNLFASSDKIKKVVLK